MSTVADRIKIACKGSNMTMEELAKKLEISKSYLSRVANMTFDEDGRSEEKRTTILFMSAVSYQTGVSLEWLLYGRGEMKDSQEGLKTLRIFKQSELIQEDKYDKILISEELCYQLTKCQTHECVGIISESNMKGCFSKDDLLLAFYKECSFATSGVYIQRRTGDICSFLNVSEKDIDGYQVSTDGNSFRDISGTELSKLSFIGKIVWAGKKL